MSQSDATTLYREMLLIRKTEEQILQWFSDGLVSGTTHTCIGQEANAVGLIGLLDCARDAVVSNHRNHGHYLAFGGSLKGLLAEIRGMEAGVSGGRGGSQHLKDGLFISSGIQGGGAPLACGIALAEKLQDRSDAVAVYCLGDGTLGQGVVYESLNLASLWSLPVLFLLENNGIAQTTPLAQGVAGSLLARGSAFGIRSYEIESTDVREIREYSQSALSYVRNERKPAWLLIHTTRLTAHSKGDDTRSPKELSALRVRDPLHLEEQKLTPAEVARSVSWVQQELGNALAALEDASR